MIQYIYMSSATSWPSHDDLRALLEQARRNNEKADITGMLVYRDATYLQALEGERDVIYALVNKIKKDPRNTAFVKLSESPISLRDFASWSMGFRNLEEENPDSIPGYVDIFNRDMTSEVSDASVSAAIRLLTRFAGGR